MRGKAIPQNHLETSKTVFQDKTPLLCNFALLSFHDSHFLDYFLLCCEYAQLISQCFLVNCLLNVPENESRNALQKFIISPFEPFTPGFLLIDFKRHNLRSLIVLGLLLVFMAGKYSLFAYCMTLAKKSRLTDNENKSFAVKLWRWVFASQGRLIYLFVTAIWSFAAFQLIRGNTNFSHEQNILLAVFCVVMTITEFLFSLMIFVYFDCVIPRKSRLASKSSSTQIITLIQKVCTQAALIFLGNHPVASVWFAVSVNLVLSIIRNWHYFSLLPPYKLKILYIESVFLMIVSALHISCFFRCVAKSTENNKENTNFIIVLWIILSVLMVYLVILYLNKVVFNFMTRLEKGSAEMRINQLIMARETIKANKLPSAFSENYEQIFLLVTVVTGKFNDIFGTKTNLKVSDKKEVLNEMFLGYLENIIQDFPQNKFVKLYAAYFYAKKVKLYGNSMRILSELQQESSMKTRFNSLLLINDLQENVRSGYQNSENILDLSQYNVCRTLTWKLKAEIVEQGKLQISICKENTKASSNLAKILSDAKKVSACRAQIQKLFKDFQRNSAEYFTKPILVYAHYSLILNYSWTSYLALSKIFNTKTQKYHKIFSSEELAKENMFHEKTGLMIVSGQKKDFGLIKYCSKQLERVFGEDLTDRSFMNCFPNMLRSSFETSLQECLNLTSSLNKILTNQLCVDTDGFLFLSSIYLNISPSLAQGFNFYVLTRRCLSSSKDKDYILIRADLSTIENFSRNIAKKLGLRVRGAITLNQICAEAEENFHDSTIEGRNLTFFSYKKQEFIYNCKIENIAGGKLLILEEEVRRPDNDPGSPQRMRLVESQFITEEEKEGEWVDFDLLERDIKKEEAEVEVEGKKQTEAILLSTERNLMPPSSTRRIANKSETITPKGPRISTEIDVKEFEEKESSVASKSRVDSQAKVSKSFEIAVTTKFYSQLYKFLLVLVYGILVGSLVSMVVLTLTLNADLALLQGRKELITSMEMENVLVVNSHRNMQILTSFANGDQDENDYRKKFRTTALLRKLSSGVLKMGEENQIFLKNIALLDPQNRERIFAKDVRIYEHETFTLFNMIEAIQKMVEIESRAAGLAKVDIGSALNDFSIIARNSLNDFLVGNQAKIDAILESSHVNKGKAFFLIDKNWFATLACMGGLAVLYVGIIIKQFTFEKRNLTAFTKLNLSRVKTVEAKITAFMDTIENEEELKPIKNMNDDAENNDFNTAVKDGSQNLRVEDKGIFLKYLLFSVYFLIMILAVIGFISLSCSSAKASINDLNSRLFQLMFVAKSMSRINLALTIPVELFANNDLTLIENNIPSVELVEMIKELDTIQKSFLREFDAWENIDSLNNILYENACSALARKAQISSCEQLQKGLGSGYSSGFVQFIDYLRSFLMEVASDYESSDKSRSSLGSLQKEYINDEMSDFLVMAPINKVLISKLDWEFENKIDQSRVQSTLLNSLLYVFLIGVCFVLYFGVLKKIGESDNEFKKVLRVFPSDLIFSNFILKSYLLKTSAGALSSVINTI